MKRTAALPLFLLLAFSACNVVVSDAGPVITANDDIDAGKAETAKADIRLNVGELHINGGGQKLMSATYKFSESMGRPVVSYADGRLSVESPKTSVSTGKTTNEWNLTLGSQVPLDANIDVKVGQADIDLSKVPLSALQVSIATGELTLNLAGKYTKDLDVRVSCKVGEARIRLPKDTGVVVDATAGIGGVNATGLTKRDGKYYNDAYTEGKPALHVHVTGGVGEIKLSVE